MNKSLFQVLSIHSARYQNNVYEIELVFGEFCQVYINLFEPYIISDNPDLH